MSCGWFTSLLAFCPSLSWIACGRSQTKEKSVMDSLDSPLERSIVSLSSQKSRCLEPRVTRFGSAWNLMVSLPAPCSFPQRLSGLHNFASTEKWQCPKGHWKSRTKLWTSSEAAGCGTLYRGPVVDHCEPCATLWVSQGEGRFKLHLSLGWLCGRSPVVHPARRAF